jgi:hypothetical protein
VTESIPGARCLVRPRREVHKLLGEVVAVESKGTRFGPDPNDQVVGIMKIRCCEKFGFRSGPAGWLDQHDKIRSRQQAVDRLVMLIDPDRV